MWDLLPATIGLQILVLNASTGREIDAASQHLWATARRPLRRHRPLLQQPAYPVGPNLERSDARCLFRVTGVDADLTVRIRPPAAANSRYWKIVGTAWRSASAANCSARLGEREADVVKFSP